MARKQVEAKVTSSNDGQTSSSDAKSTVLEQTTSKAAGFLWASKDFLVLKRCANNAETRSNGPRQCQPQCGRLRTFKSCSNKAQAESKPNNYPFWIWATRTWKPIWFNWAPCPIALHTFPTKNVSFQVQASICSSSFSLPLSRFGAFLEYPECTCTSDKVSLDPKSWFFLL
jgi:hypothetical protein